jgi:hypothetical protein
MELTMENDLGAGLNVFQRLALISQFFTVFGGLMFVLTDLLELQDARPDGNGRTIMSWLIFFVNTLSTTLYPLYKFFNAWSENGEIDFSFVKDGLLKCLELFVGSQLAESLLNTCGCCQKIKDTVDDAQEVKNTVSQ